MCCGADDGFSDGVSCHVAGEIEFEILSFIDELDAFEKRSSQAVFMLCSSQDVFPKIIEEPKTQAEFWANRWDHKVRR